MAGLEDRERARILKVIEDETAAYFNKDFDAWARHWVHAPYARRLGWYARGGPLIHNGWQAESDEMREQMKAFPARNRAAAEVRRENVNIRVGADMAWVTFEQIAPNTGDAFDTPGRQHEGRVLEKHDGEWRIAACFVVGSSMELVSSPLIRVDAARRILWMNDAAAKALKAHRALTVVGARLSGADRYATERLQASIDWAADHKTYADFQNDPQMAPSRRGTLPVILGGDDDTLPDICWVTVDLQMILVSFDDEPSTLRRLESAAIVYGLTPAQLRLAALIVAGLDLVEAAGKLGVSANTTRTHLQRMFDKTGARSQAALVKLLLTVGSPLV